MNPDSKKLKVAKSSLDYIEHDCVLGVGTGSTVNFLIDLLPDLINKIQAVVSSSDESTKRLEAHGFEISNLNNIGNIYYYKGNYDKALAYYSPSLEEDEKNEDKYGLGNTLSNIGIIYHDMGNSKKALEYSIRALELREDIGHKLGIGISLHNIGVIYYEIDDYKIAEQYLVKSLAIQNEIGVGKDNLLETTTYLYLTYKKIDEGYEITNGPTFSPDCNKIYFTDTKKGEIYVSNLSLYGKFLQREITVGEEVFLYTHFIVRQEELSLYGFLNAQDKAIFSLLLSVNGVGPKSALGLLSIFDSVSIAEAVIAGDIDTISKAPGLGKKTASRVVLELQSKLSGSSGFSVGVLGA